MYNNHSSSTNAENDKTDSWSFSFDYQRFSNKNKPKSLLGRRTLAQIFPQENQATDVIRVNSSNRPSVPGQKPLMLEELNGPSLTHPVNPNVTPIHKFSQPTTFDSQRISTKKGIQTNENCAKSCQRGLGFSTPYKLKDCQPLKDISSSYEQTKFDESKTKYEVNGIKEITKDISSDFVISNILNKDLNTSFICEDTFPLPEDIFHSNDGTLPVNLLTVSKTTDLSHTDNINNTCFMTAHEIHPPDLSLFNNFKTPRKNLDSMCLKTPGRNFTLFSVSQSPIDPLAGILNEDNESFISDNSVCNTPSTKVDPPDCLQDPTVINVSPPKSSAKEVVSERGKKEVQNTLNNPPSKKNEVCSLSEESLANQTEKKSISKDSETSHSNHQAHQYIEIKSSCQDLPQKTYEFSSSNESNKLHNPSSMTPSTNARNPPTVIVNHNEGQIMKQPFPIQQSHPLQVPSQQFINSRLIIKPQPQNILYINDKPYAALSLLGRGGSSEVYQVLEENSSRLLAIKCVNLATVEDSTANGYLNEIELLSKLQGCPSVIKMFDHEYVESTKMLYVVMEKGDIDFSKLMKDITKIKKIPMSMIIYYWTEMLSAVKDIHDKGVIHSDLKPGNFLLVCGRLKLIDFGIASSLQGDMTSVEKDVIRGTFNYISPEAISAGENRYHKINYKSDVWSLGCILYNLLFGCTPFSHITSTLGKFQAIADPNYKIKFPKDNNHVPPALKLSLKWCLIKDPKARPTVDRLLKLSEHAVRVPQIDKLWYQYVIEEFPDCCISIEDITQ